MEQVTTSQCALDQASDVENYSGLQSGRLSPGRLSPGRLSPGRLSPGRLSPGRLSPGRLSPGRLSPGRLSPGRLSPGRLSPGRLSPGRLSPGRLSPGRLSPGRLSPGRLSPGRLSSGRLFCNKGPCPETTICPGPFPFLPRFSQDGACEVLLPISKLFYMFGLVNLSAAAESLYAAEEVRRATSPVPRRSARIEVRVRQPEAARPTCGWNSARIPYIVPQQSTIRCTFGFHLIAIAKMSEKGITKSAASGIPKLVRTNYVQWCVDVQLLLEEKGIWSFAVGKQEEPPATASAQEKQKFAKDKAKSRAIILQSLVPRLQPAAMNTYIFLSSFTIQALLPLRVSQKSLIKEKNWINRLFCDTLRGSNVKEDRDM
uniref:DUF4219 domain-containing protein n=1 Tax=Strigamia maritima TaxID=126957 RepID=T1JET6_STRMM